MALLNLERVVVITDVFYRKSACVLKLEVNATILDNGCFYFETKLNSSLKLMVDAVLINALDRFFYGVFFYWLYLTTTWGNNNHLSVLLGNRPCQIP